MFEILWYVEESGKIPFNEWVSSLKDKKVRAVIDARLSRLSLGLMGDCKTIQGAGDIRELRIDFGAGCRVYFSQVGKKIVLLLIGGDKSTQSKDIKKAKLFLEDYNRRKNG